MVRSGINFAKGFFLHEGNLFSKLCFVELVNAFEEHEIVRVYFPELCAFYQHVFFAVGVVFREGGEGATFKKIVSPDVVKRLVSCKDAFQQVCAHVFRRHSKPPSASRGAINSPKESISSTFSQVG